MDIALARFSTYKTIKQLHWRTPDFMSPELWSSNSYEVWAARLPEADRGLLDVKEWRWRLMHWAKRHRLIDGVHDSKREFNSRW